ncbi:MAG: ribonuclease domain-containing protein [Jatrophihabitantaceae bacterium]
MRRIRRPLLALIALVLALAIGYGVNAAGSDHKPGPSTHTSAPPDSSTSLSSLPRQARDTVALIKRGGPFPYPRNDGVVFHNDEHRLPAEREGYYHEYTVPTPGSADRGTRRIITGAGGEYYYTGDHYEHFARIDVTR